MANFTVTPNTLREQSKKLDNEANDYESASKAAKSAADTLAAGWEGDAQRSFVAEQEKAYGWYTEMTALARQYSVFLNDTATKYEIADQEAASAIGN